MTWSTDEGWTRAPGGLVRAVAPVLASRGGATAWLGLLSSGAPTPPTRLVDTELFIERIRPRLEQNALEGFTNRTLWPALYGLTGLIEHLDDWRTGHLRLSEAVAQRLASALAVGGTAWLHDDHLIGAVGGLRSRRDDVRIVWTAHTPIDRVGVGSLVHTRHLLGALSGADAISVQTERDAEELQRLLRALDLERPGPRIAARPVGFDPSWWERARDNATVAALARRHRSSEGALLVAVDRAYYTKGIVHRLHALDLALADGALTPDEVRLVQIAVPTRGDIPVYRRLRAEIARTTEEINRTWRRRDGRPVVELVTDPCSPTEVAGLLRAGDVALVTPVRDGMNLVAFEHAALNGDRAVELVLGAGAGAAEALGDVSRLVDGQDVFDVAAAIVQSVRTPSADLAARSARRAAIAATRSSSTWADGVLGERSRSDDWPGTARGRSTS